MNKQNYIDVLQIFSDKEPERSFSGMTEMQAKLDKLEAREEEREKEKANKEKEEKLVKKVKEKEQAIKDGKVFENQLIEQNNEIKNLKWNRAFEKYNISDDAKSFVKSNINLDNEQFDEVMKNMIKKHPTFLNKPIEQNKINDSYTRIIKTKKTLESQNEQKTPIKRIPNSFN